MTQNEALEKMKSGANIFLTGEPGSGKTFTINQFVEWCEGAGQTVAITASTGIAATHIGGTTIHAWCGMNISDDMTPAQINAIKGYKKIRMEEADVLVIDEVSMMHAHQIDLIDKILRDVRKDGKDKPFGGIQIIFVGDFFQLPPVTTSGEQVRFAFDSQAWQGANLEICYLTEQHRQSDDRFLDLLTSMRAGTITQAHKDILAARAQERPEGEITWLFTHRGQVDTLNDHELAKIKRPYRVFDLKGFGLPNLVMQLRKGCLSPDRLILKEGAVVMFTKNNFDPDSGEVLWVNGTVGQVMGFEEGYPIVRTTDGRICKPRLAEWAIEEHKIDKYTGEEYTETLARIQQVPLCLAWALTVHKSQGMSLDRAVVDLSKTFETGQGYVALSRVRSLDGLFIKGLNDKVFDMHPRVVEFDKRIRV